MTTSVAVQRIAAIAERLRPAVLAGSLLAVPDDRQLQYARALADGDAWIHVDLIDETYPLGAGVDPGLLDDLDRWSGRLDVHLLTSEPLALSDTVLRHRPARVTVQVEDLLPTDPTGIQMLAHRCAAAGSRLCLGVAPSTELATVTALLDQAAEILIMLAEPGCSGATVLPSALARLDDLGAHRLAVDGGVTDDIFPALRTAGVEHVVIGRWLWWAINDEADARSALDLTTTGGDS